MFGHKSLTKRCSFRKTKTLSCSESTRSSNCTTFHLHSFRGHLVSWRRSNSDLGLTSLSFDWSARPSTSGEGERETEKERERPGCALSSASFISSCFPPDICLVGERRHANKQTDKQRRSLQRMQMKRRNVVDGGGYIRTLAAVAFLYICTLLTEQRCLVFGFF